MDYRKLRGRITEVYKTQEAFAKDMGLSLASINQRLSGKLEWKASEIALACEHLGIDLAEAHEYFFVKRT